MFSEGEKQKQLDRELRDMISALTRRLANLQTKSGGGGGGEQEEDDDGDDNGVRIITLAGSNVGATLRGELGAEDQHKQSGTTPSAASPEGLAGDQDPLSTYVNSNFQSINNSIMMGGSYSTNDPGVHMDVSDYIEPQPIPATHKYGKKIGKKHDKTSDSKSDHKYSERSSMSP